MPDGYPRILKASKCSFISRAAFSLHVDSKSIRLTFHWEHFSTVEYTGSQSRWAPSPSSPLEKYETGEGRPGKEKQESCRERECTGWKATGKVFFHMLIRAGCAHEYLWSKRAFLSLPSPPLAHASVTIFARSLVPVAYTLSRKLLRFLSTADDGREIGRNGGCFSVEMSAVLELPGNQI